MTKLKKYETNIKNKMPEKREPIPSGVGCSEKDCKGEMMITQPFEDHYSFGRRGEPGAIKSGLKRAVCSKCGWRGWV